MSRENTKGQGSRPGRKQAPQKRTIKSKPQPNLPGNPKSKPQPKPKAGKPKPKPRTKPKAVKSKFKPQRNLNAGKPKLQTKPKSVKYKPQKPAKVKIGARKLKLQAGIVKPEANTKDQKSLKSETETAEVGTTAPDYQKPAEPVQESKNPAQGLTKSESKDLPTAEAKNNEAEAPTKSQNAPKLNIHLTLKKLGADFVAYDPRNKSAFKLDPLAFYVCTLCDGANSTAQIAQKLESVLKENNLAPPVKDIEKEVEMVVNALSQNGIVFVD